MRTSRFIALGYIAFAAVCSTCSLTGCDSGPEYSEARDDGETLYIGVQPVDSAPRRATAAAPAEKSPAPQARSGMRLTELAYPTGDRSTSTILLRMSAPGEMRVGEEYDYTIDVINLTRGDLQNVQVYSEHYSNLTYVRSTPPFTELAQDEISWMIGDLPAGATKQIKVTAKANALGTASNCLTVRYANVLCIATDVVQPVLQLTKTATPEICGTCEEITLTYEVRNSGTGIAEKAVIKDTLPAGLTTVDGRNVVEINAGDLGPGQSKPFTVRAKATKSGSYSSGATARASGLEAESDKPATVVKQPVLAVTCEASERVFVGRDINYRFTVKNTGDCAASGAVVNAAVPAGSTFVSADNSGTAQAGKVSWKVANIPAGGTSTVTMKVRPSGIGNLPISATASATCVPAVSTNCSTQVAGIPAILLEVVDTDDPIEVGATTTFIVTATNQGSAQDTNVKVVATLPAEMEFVSGTGSSAVTGSGQTVTMAAVPSVAAGAAAEWRIVVRAKGVADARSRWSLTSDQFKDPIVENESTNLYQFR